MTTDEIAEWRDKARDWVLDNTRAGEVFSGNELWHKGLPKPENRRLLGSVLLGLESDGLLQRAGQTPSEGGHGQRILRWFRPGVLS